MDRSKSIAGRRRQVETAITDLHAAIAEGSAVIGREPNYGDEDELRRFADALAATQDGERVWALAQRTGTLDDFDRAMAVFASAVAAHVPQSAVMLASIGDILRQRYGFSENSDDIALAMEVSQTLISELDVRGAFDRDSLLIAAATVCDAYWATGVDVTILDRAIDVACQLVDRGETDEGFHRYLNTTSGLLHARFDRDARRQDLTSSTDLLRRAIKASAHSGYDVLVMRLNLVDLLLDLEIMDRNPALVAEARATLLRTMQEEDEPPIHLVARIEVLCAESLTRSTSAHSGVSVDELTAAAKFAENGLSSCQAVGWGIPRARATLANCLVALHERGEPDVLGRAIAEYERVVTDTGPSSSNQIAYRCALAQARRYRAGETGLTEDFDSALICHRSIWASDLPSGSYLDRLRASLDWGDWALRRNEFPEAVEALNYGFVDILRTVHRQSTPEDKTAWLVVAQQIATMLCSALMAVGQHEHAVAVLDAGRAVLLREKLSIPIAERAGT